MIMCEKAFSAHEPTVVLGVPNLVIYTNNNRALHLVRDYASDHTHVTDALDRGAHHGERF
jgi:hypothetical protein